MTEQLARRVDIEGGFDSKSRKYGIAAANLRFYVSGPLGTVQLVLMTNWYPRDVLHHPDIPPLRGWDIGYHSPTPRYAGQSQMDCGILPGGKCYYNASTRNADSWIEGFILDGTDWLWPRLEQYYKCVFEGGDYPDLTPIHRNFEEKIND